MDNNSDIVARKKASWQFLAQVSQFNDQWWEFQEQINHLNGLRTRARAMTERQNYPRVTEAQAIVEDIDRLMQTLQAIPRKLRGSDQLRDVLPEGFVNRIRKEINPTYIKGTCEILLLHVPELETKIGPAPAGWPALADTMRVLLDAEDIRSIETKVRVLEETLRKFDADEWVKWNRAEEDRRTAEQQRAGQITSKEKAADSITQAEPLSITSEVPSEQRPNLQNLPTSNAVKRGTGGREYTAWNQVAIERVRQIQDPDHDAVEKVLRDIRGRMESEEGKKLDSNEWSRRRHNIRSSLNRVGLLPTKKH